MHDFKKFPELRNSQMDLYYFESPHKQITEDFKARVVKVIDGDTVRLKTNFRDFDFPLRVSRIQAPELDEEGGLESALWLKNRILGQEVDIEINPLDRVGKFGRLLGEIVHMGERISDVMLRERRARIFGEFKEGEIPIFENWEVNFRGGKWH